MSRLQPLRKGVDALQALKRLEFGTAICTPEGALHPTGVYLDPTD